MQILRTLLLALLIGGPGIANASAQSTWYEVNAAKYPCPSLPVLVRNLPSLPGCEGVRGGPAKATFLGAGLLV